MNAPDETDISRQDGAALAEEVPFEPEASEAVELRVAELAKLSAVNYEVVREAEAKALKIRVSVLDRMVEEKRPAKREEPGSDPFEAVEPWPDAVDGAALAEEIRASFRAHVVFGSACDADLATLWAMGSYLMDTWRLWPKLMITSPTKQCGKSTLLEVLEAFVCKGMIVSNTKSAGVFRAIETWRPCLLFDEADTWMKEDAELGGILNCGHTRRTARVIRVVEKNGELMPVQFSTWAAMAIAGIGSQRDTLMSRSIVISLRRRVASETVQRLTFDLHERMYDRRRQIARWASDNSIRIGASNAEPPDCGNDRRRDNFTPLYRIAEAIGGVWPSRLAAAYVAQAVDDDDSDEPAGVMLLRALAGIFAERRADRLQSADIVLALVDMEERPWAEWKHGRALNVQSVARLLKPFEVRPRNTKVNGSVLKSYHRADVQAAFDRYSQEGQKKPLPRYPIENVEENGTRRRYHAPEVASSSRRFSEQNQLGSAVAGKIAPVEQDTLGEGEI